VAETFVDREVELDELRRLTDSDSAEMALLYGRRRVGKTYLLSRAWDDPFYFLAADTTSQTNLRDLILELARWTGRKLEVDDYPTWRTAFRLLAEVSGERPGEIFVLDEFQYLLQGEEDVASQLTAVWDAELSSSPLLLVLCGSEVATMEALQGSDSPLFGRLSWAARLRPFDYLEASMMLPWLDRRAAMYTYGALGGMPRYLAAIEHGESPREAICRTMLSPRGEVHVQLQELIAVEKGIRNTAEYEAVLRSVASGRRTLSDISSGAGLEGRIHVARRTLDVLEGLGLIRRDRNYGAGPKASWRYCIADNALLFWHRFVEPNRSRLERGRIGEVWVGDIEPALDTYMGRLFERVARRALLRLYGQWGLPEVTVCSRWEGMDRNRRPIEMDIVGELASGEMITGEVKWSSGPVGPEVHWKLKGNLEALAASGRGWAADALKGRFVYFSAGGFSDHMSETAAGHGKVLLLTLEEILPR